MQRPTPDSQTVDSVLKEAVDFVSTRSRSQPTLGLVLGSGLGSYADTFADSTTLPYSLLPGFPLCSVPGHSGNLVTGSVGSTTCIALQGRFHYYEGHSMRDVAFPVRVLASLGVRSLIVTNAAGGLNPEFRPGDFMLIEDHINLMGSNPLVGDWHGEPEARFADMSRAYDPDLKEIAIKAAGARSIRLRRGIYIGVSGPCYETPAEIRMYRSFGGDAIGMSTIPEVIAAVQAGIGVLGLSCIANMAAGIGTESVTHHEVLETANKAKAEFSSLLDGVIEAAGTAQ